MNLTQRLRTAFQIITKGGLYPFNRVIDDGSTADKLTEPMRNSVWVMRAIKLVSQPIGAVDLYFTDGADNEITDPTLTAYWKQPAQRMDYAQLVEASIGWLKLSGEFFWLLDDMALQFGPAKLGKLIVARPDRMRHIVERDQLIGWEYRDGAGNWTALLPEQVIHEREWNPYDDWRGLSEYEAAKVASEADYLSGRYALNMAKNNGDRGPYIVARNGLPTDQQRQQIISQLREKRSRSQAGDYRPVFLTGDITVEDPKVQTPDAAFVAQRVENRHEIFIAFGVPPSMADLAQSYSIGSASDRFVLIEETCKPAGEKILSAITAVSERILGRPLTAQMDWDEHSTMQSVRRERIDAALKLWGVGMPMRQINEYLNLGLTEFPGWDMGYLPFSVTPTEALPEEEPSASDDYAEEPDQTNQESIQRMVERLAPSFRAQTPAERARWREHMAKRRESIKSFETRFNRMLQQARAEVLAKLNGQKMVAGQKAVAVQFIFDKEKWKNALLAAFRPLETNALQKAGQQLLDEMGKDDPWKTPDTVTLQFLRNRENKLSNVADDVWNNIRDQLDEGINAGDSIDELSARIRAAFNSVSKERARRIAMTETAAAYGTGRQAAMADAGVQWKRWLTSGNANVRPAHAAANGQIVRADEEFTVGGEQLKYPGDPTGSPGNVINCHCVAVPVAEGPAEETQQDRL